MKLKEYLISENSETSILLLNKVNLLWDELLIFQCVWQMSVEYFQIRHVSLGGTIYLDHKFIWLLRYCSENCKIGLCPFFSIPQESVYLLFTKMDIENLTISDAQTLHILFPTYSTRFQYLNFANNILTDELFFKNLSICFIWKLSFLRAIDWKHFS